jgi:hypothetical protein
MGLCFGILLPVGATIKAGGYVANTTFHNGKSPRRAFTTGIAYRAYLPCV